MPPAPRRALPALPDVERALRDAWARDTSDDVAGWSEDNTPFGQCAVSALVVRAIYGGDIVIATVLDRDGNRTADGHAWNVLPSGESVDFTFHQFRDGEQLGEPIVTEPVIDGDPRRAHILAERVAQALGVPVVLGDEVTDVAPEQPVGPPVPGWTPRPRPADDLTLEGRLVRLERLRPDHVADLFAAYAGHDRLWTYMPSGPWPDEAAYRAWAEPSARSRDPFFLAIVDRASGRAVGVAAYLRITPEHGTIEVGFITFSPALQGTTGATEAMALMARHAFDDLGYRRYEWKCDALNAPSRRAAARLGFTFEGVHRQAIVTKGRNRDTAWFSILDAEWPAVRAALDAWLAPENFDAKGRQRSALSHAAGPAGVPPA